MDINKIKELIEKDNSIYKDNIVDFFLGYIVNGDYDEELLEEIDKDVFGKDYDKVVNAKIEAKYGKTPLKGVVIGSKKFNEIMDELKGYQIDKELLKDKDSDYYEGEILRVYLGIGNAELIAEQYGILVDSLVSANEVDLDLPTNREQINLFGIGEGVAIAEDVRSSLEGKIIEDEDDIVETVDEYSYEELENSVCRLKEAISNGMVSTEDLKELGKRLVSNNLLGKKNTLNKQILYYLETVDKIEFTQEEYNFKGDIKYARYTGIIFLGRKIDKSDKKGVEGYKAILEGMGVKDH